MKFSAEKLLGIAAESSEMKGWSDSLSYMVSSVEKKYQSRCLSDEELGMVAGGVNTDELLVEKLKNKIFQ